LDIELDIDDICEVEGVVSVAGQLSLITYHSLLVTVFNCFPLDMYTDFIEDYAPIENPKLKEVYP
jgi:hypothetical protein